MTNAMPFLPDINFPITDVRDVALAHLRAMITLTASNNRHIIVCRQKCVHFKELAEILQQEFGANYSIPSRVAPNCVMKMLALFYKPVKQVMVFFFN
jgi:dihydroflavonol-4-reductase